MSIGTKKNYLCGLAITLAINMCAMESAEKKPKKSKPRRVQTWITRAGHNVMGIFSSQNAQQRDLFIEELQQQDPFLFNNLPEDARNQIIGFLMQGATAETLEIAAYTINALAQVNHQFNALFNDPTMCLKIIKNLSQRFKCSNFTVCSVLQIKQAKKQCRIQNDFLRMCQHRWPQEETFAKLWSAGLDIEFTYLYEDKIVTPLILSAFLDNSRTFFYLMQAGANINQTNAQGMTALMIAIIIETTHLSQFFKAFPSIIKQLIADPNLAINQQNLDGNSALMVCLQHLNPEYLFKLELLLNAGADPELANNRGETPLSLAQATGIPTIIALIQKAIDRKHAR